jgi:hypothetical protein
MKRITRSLVGSGSGTTSSEASSQVLTPLVPMTASNLAVELSASPGATRTFTFRVDGAPTALSCSVTGLDPFCSDTSSVVNIPAGSAIALESSSTGIPNSATVRFGISLGQ